MGKNSGPLIDIIVSYPKILLSFTHILYLISGHCVSRHIPGMNAVCCLISRIFHWWQFNEFAGLNIFSVSRKWEQITCTGILRFPKRPQCRHEPATTESIGF